MEVILTLKPRILSSVAKVENLGEELPTGSITKKKKKDRKFPLDKSTTNLTCTWETETPEPDIAESKSRRFECRQPII